MEDTLQSIEFFSNAKTFVYLNETMMKRIAEGVSRIFLACGLSKYSDNVAEQICANLSMDYVQVYVSASKNDVDIITENLLFYTTPCFEAFTYIRREI